MYPYLTYRSATTFAVDNPLMNHFSLITSLVSPSSSSDCSFLLFDFFPLPLLDMQMLDFLRYQRTLSFHFFLKEFHLLTRLCTDNSQIYILSTDLFWELQSYIIGTATSISQNTSNWTCLKLICYFPHPEMSILP